MPTKNNSVPHQSTMALHNWFAESNMAEEETCKSSDVQVVRGRRVAWDGEGERSVLLWREQGLQHGLWEEEICIRMVFLVAMELHLVV